MTELTDSLEKLVYSLPKGREYLPRVGDDVIDALVYLVNQPGDELRRVSAFILLVRSEATIDINVSLRRPE